MADQSAQCPTGRQRHPRCRPAGARLTGADLTNCNLSGADLRDTDIEKANTTGTTLVHCRLK
ncbi:pentapeptide repeat-containing protein [Azospirillum formosense]|uniref:pentapeptide repeat-containing protein n=1 Tax=Azospirillum formosense TaxID=861533 RepID=UPI001C90958D